MRRTSLSLFALTFVICLLSGTLSAQEAFWKVTHKRPNGSATDTSLRPKQIQFYKTLREKVDMLDGAEGSHYALWGDIFVGGEEQHTVWASSDSGMTWTEVLRTTISTDNAWHVSEITCPEPNYLYVLALQGNVSQFAKVLRSTDGGTTWGETIFPRIDDYAKQAQIAMADGRNGFLVLTAQEGLFRTTDGWKTWEHVKSPLPVTGDIFCPEPNVYFVTGATAVYRSTDGGENWTTPEDRPLQVIPVRKYSFVDREYGWGIGAESTGIGDRQRSYVTRTTDGGVTWKEVYKDDEMMGGGVLTVEFADRMNGLIGVRGGIYRTTDGGESWISEPLPNEEIGANPFIVYISNPLPESAVAILTGNSIITSTGTSPLSAPVITHPATAIFDHDDTITVTWSSVPNATSYQIQMARRKTSDLSVEYDTAIVVDAPNLTETARFFQLEYGDWLYIFRVRAMNDGDTSRWSTRQSVAPRIDPMAPVTPTVLYPPLESENIPTTVRIVWNSIPGATHYHLQVGTEPLNVPGVTLLIDNPFITDTTFLLNGLHPYTMYFCRVMSLNDAGTSRWSSEMMPHLFETGQTVSVADAQSERSSIDIVPNPARGRVTISLPERAELTGVFDLTGRLVWTSSEKPIGGSEENLLDVDLKDFPSGMYMLRIRMEDQTTTERMFVLP